MLLLNRNLSVNLPIKEATRKQESISIWNPLVQNLPIQERMKKLSKMYPNASVILQYPRTYKNTWKEIYYFIHNHKHVMVYFGDANDPEVKPDWIMVSNQKVVKRVGNGASRFVSKLLEPNYIEEQLKQLVGEEKFKLLNKISRTNKEFKQQIEFIFSNLEVDTDILFDLMRPTEHDLFLFKLYYVVWFKKSKDTTFLRHYESENYKYDAEILVDAVKRWLKIDIKLEDIYIDREETLMDETFIEVANENANAFA